MLHCGFFDLFSGEWRLIFVRATIQGVLLMTARRLLSFNNLKAILETTSLVINASAVIDEDIFLFSFIRISRIFLTCSSFSSR